MTAPKRPPVLASDIDYEDFTADEQRAMRQRRICGDYLQHSHAHKRACGRLAYLKELGAPAALIEDYEEAADRLNRWMLHHDAQGCPSSVCPPPQSAPEEDVLGQGAELKVPVGFLG